jgi:hypothetical protein
MRYLLSIGVGNALYFLLYTSMLVYATNTLERAACMFFSYGGIFESKLGTHLTPTN